MKPRLEILAAAQRRLWPELAEMPKHFVLYRGTAVALRVGGRESLDFDFFTDRRLDADALFSNLQFLRGAEVLQAEPDTATFAVEREGEVNVSFFGGLTFGRVGEPDVCDDNGIRVASLLDLTAQKLKVILVRAEPKDYLDLYTLLRDEVDLAQALGAARALYPAFNPLLSLKALTYYGEPALDPVPRDVREFLTASSGAVGKIEPVARISPGISCADL